MLAAHGEFNGDEFDELAVGSPGDASIGTAQEIFGFFTHLADTGNQLWHQGLLNSSDSYEAGDDFGAALV
ncbi:MAG: hypothetical protein IT427_11680 [Pirellulales bacterium]|nr:hypothetical protein [Pirellulales bacterium]